MSDKPEAPSLLSAERIAKVTNWHARLLANYEKHATDEAINAAGLGGIGVLLDDMADLLADRTAFRQAVAEQLRGLLVSDSVLKAMSVMDRAHSDSQNRRIHAAAHALNITL